MLRLALSLLANIPSAHAQGFAIITDILGCRDASGNLGFVTGRITAECIPSFIAHLIQLLFSLLGLFFLLNVMYAGYEIAMGAASGGGRESGVRRLQWSIIGLAVSVCSFLILDLVVTVLIG